MIGSGLKKLAERYGMKVDQGVAYGAMEGFQATMCEGSGYKQIIFATSIPDAVKQTELQTALNGRNLQKEFRVTNLSIAPRNICITFHDNPGTMKRIEAFLEWFLPLLREAGAVGANICPECGFEVSGGCWKLIDGVAYHMHQPCADKVCREITESDEMRRTTAEGSYASGLLGALLGSVLGAVIWAVIMYLGYVASLAGLAIGWLAERGYHLLKGKQGKGKIVILIIAVIIGVLLGNLGADVITLVEMMNTGELEGFVYGDIPMLIVAMLTLDPGYLQATLGNIGLGLVFAGLGVWGLLRRANAEVADTKIRDLK